MRCDKCFTLDDYSGARYAQCTYHGEKKEYFLCGFCNNVFNNKDIDAFMRDDYESFPMPRITRSMIDARKRRATGTSPWEKCEIDKNKDDN